MRIRIAIFLALFVVGGLGSAGIADDEVQPRCADEALEQAPRLLAFHFGEDDDRIAIEPEVTELPPLANPVDEEQQFKVLEVWGHIYKGKYRMRFIYHEAADECVLMGQEILEYAQL